LVLIAVWLGSAPTWAVPITLFQDTDTYIERARDIVVAECLSVPPSQSGDDGLYAVEVKVLLVLKGNRKPGGLRVATIYPMKPAARYLLTNSGGSALGTDFLALPELSVVPVPEDFPLEKLQGKPVKEQLQRIFARQLFDVERQIEPLQEQQAMLAKAIQGRAYDLVKLDNVRIERVLELSTTEEGKYGRYLDLGGAKLSWSHSEPGKSGYLYFDEASPLAPYWEFARCDACCIEDLDGKPLEARFYGQYSPGRKRALRQSDYHTVRVSVGEMLLVRTARDPSLIYALETKSQDATKETIAARCAVIRTVQRR